MRPLQKSQGESNSELSASEAELGIGLMLKLSSYTVLRSASRCNTDASFKLEIFTEIHGRSGCSTLDRNFSTMVFVLSIPRVTLAPRISPYHSTTDRLRIRMVVRSSSRHALLT